MLVKILSTPFKVMIWAVAVAIIALILLVKGEELDA